MKKKKAYILFVVATIIWGFAFVAQKAAVVLPPFTVCAMRAGIAALFLMLAVPFTDRLTETGRSFYGKGGLDINRKELIYGSLLGLLLTVSSVLQQAGLENTDAGKAAFITTLYVLLVPLISTFLGKKPSLNVLIGVPVAIFGFYLLCIRPGIGIAPSDLLVLCCGITFSFHIILVDRAAESCEGVRLSLVQFAVSFALDAILGLIFEGMPSGEAIMSVILPLLFLGIGSSGIAYTLQIIGQKDADPSVASIILSLEAVFATIGGAIVLGERMSGRESIGCALVLLATIVAEIEPSFFKKLFKNRNKANNT